MNHDYLDPAAPPLRRRRKYSLVMHFAGHIKIRKGNTLTLINETRGGLPVCTMSPSTQASWTFERPSVTCKRCLRMLQEHDRTAEEELAR
jgi:hypothetical protein